jgi:hypothetical protein
MNREELRTTLEKLRHDLAGTATSDPHSRALLDRLQGDIRAVLEDDAADPSSLHGRLNDSVAHFDASHPALARRLAEVIDTLALWNL